MNFHPSLGRTTMQLLLSAAFLAAPASMAHGQTASKIFEADLPNVPGKTMTNVIVDYPPGASSLPHRHAESGFVFVYVLSGTVRSQVDGGPVKLYEAGSFWTEGPGAHHTVSENASESEPARLLVVFIADPADTLTTYEQAESRQSEKK